MTKYTNDQLIQVIDSLIINNTEYSKKDFTGGSIGVTLVNNATILKYKFTMYFGFKNKNAISKVIEVDKNIYNILVDALEVKTKSLLDGSNKLSLNDINTILTTGSKVGINTKGTTSTKTKTINTKTINTKTIESKIIEDEIIKETPLAHRAIDYLNKLTNKNFAYGKGNVKEINAQIKKGATEENLKYVIDVKVNEWLNNEDMKQHLNPVTLFRETNFNKYLNQDFKIKGTLAEDEYIRQRCEGII